MDAEFSRRSFSLLLRHARNAHLMLLIASATTVVIGLASVNRDAPLKALHDLETLKHFPSFTLFSEEVVDGKDINTGAQPAKSGKGTGQLWLIVGGPLFKAEPKTTAPRAIVWANPVTIEQYSNSLRTLPQYTVLEPENLIAFLNTVPKTSGCKWTSVSLQCSDDPIGSSPFVLRLDDGTPVFVGRTEEEPFKYSVDVTLVAKNCAKMIGEVKCPKGKMQKESIVSGFINAYTVLEPGPITLSEVNKFKDPRLKWYFKQLVAFDGDSIREVLPRAGPYQHLISNLAVDDATRRLQELVVARSEALDFFNFHFPEFPFLIIAPASIFLSLLYSMAFVKRIGDFPLQGKVSTIDRSAWVILLPGWEAELLVVATYVVLPTLAILALVVRAGWGGTNKLAFGVNVFGIVVSFYLGGKIAYLVAQLRARLHLTAFPAAVVRALRLRKSGESIYIS